MCLRTLPDLTNISWRMDIGLDITNLSWRMKSGETVGKLDSGIYLVRVGRISTSAVGETMKADGGINSEMEMDKIKMDGRVKIDHGDITDISAPRW